MEKSLLDEDPITIRQLEREITTLQKDTPMQSCDDRQSDKVLQSKSEQVRNNQLHASHRGSHMQKNYDDISHKTSVAEHGHNDKKEMVRNPESVEDGLNHPLISAKYGKLKPNKSANTKKDFDSADWSMPKAKQAHANQSQATIMIFHNDQHPINLSDLQIGSLDSIRTGDNDKPKISDGASSNMPKGLSVDEEHDVVKSNVYSASSDGSGFAKHISVPHMSSSSNDRSVFFFFSSNFLALCLSRSLLPIVLLTPPLFFLYGNFLIAHVEIDVHVRFFFFFFFFEAIKFKVLKELFFGVV
jgi:hypothetical protein